MFSWLLRYGPIDLVASPKIGGSTFITSAPRSLSIFVQYPPEYPFVKSRTFIPSNACLESVTMKRGPFLMVKVDISTAG